MDREMQVVIVNRNSQILAHGVHGSNDLPVITVARGRLGISVTRAVREQLHLEVFHLTHPAHTKSAVPCLRIQSESSPLPIGYSWYEASAVASDCAATKSSSALPFAPLNEEFGSYDWYALVQKWLSEEMSKLGHSVQSLEQWNGRRDGVLIRIATEGPQYWFKADGGFALHEISIAQALATKHPKHFARVFTTEPNWGAFLLEHVEGRELYECDELSVWQSVATQLAEIQMDWGGTEEQLLCSGAVDLRSGSMAKRIPAFLDHIDSAMARQLITPPNILSEKDLQELGDELRVLCAEVATLPFADGLANADFSPHNTLITPRGPVFIDWAEACVSLPLITGEYMWKRMLMELPHLGQWVVPLRRSYLECWSERYGSEAVIRASELMPAFSLFAVAMFYHERTQHDPSRNDCYLRSLSRQLLYAIRAIPSGSHAVRSEGRSLQPCLKVCSDS